MLNETLITNAFQHWMENFVEQPHPALGNWAPCPFARKARITQQIRLVFSEVTELKTQVWQALSGLDHQEVAVVCFDHHEVSAVTLSAWVQLWNQELMSQDYVILEDHPDDPEHIHGVPMNFGVCGLLLIQKLSKLNQASDQLRAKGYYQVWAQSELDQVVTWRYKSDSGNL
jgi:hypothetical protein